MPISYQLNNLGHLDIACLIQWLILAIFLRSSMEFVRQQLSRWYSRLIITHRWPRLKYYTLKMSTLARRSCSLLAYVISVRMPHSDFDFYFCCCWCGKRCSCTPRTSSFWLWSCLFSECFPTLIDPVSPGLGVAASICSFVMCFQLQYFQGFCAQVRVFSRMFSTSAIYLGRQCSFLPYLSIWFRRFMRASSSDFDICWNLNSPCFCPAAVQIQQLCLKLRAEHFDRLNLVHSVGSSE